MQSWILAQAHPTNLGIIDKIVDLARDNPAAALFAVTLLILIIVITGWTNELRQSRNMLNGIRKSGDEQENKALDMATNAINKIDRVADSITDMASAMRESSSNYFASAQLNADSHVKTTTLLVERIAAMDAKRAEDEIYSNGKLLVQVDERMTLAKEEIARLVGTILHDAAGMHDTTRRVVTENNELLMTALRATPPAPLPPPSDKADSKTE